MANTMGPSGRPPIGPQGRLKVNQGERKSGAKAVEKVSIQERRKQVSHEAWEAVFEILFDRHLVKAPHALFKEELFFKDPRDLDN